MIESNDPDNEQRVKELTNSLVDRLLLEKITPTKQKQAAKQFYHALGKGCSWGIVSEYDPNRSIDACLLACACCGMREFDGIDNPERTFESISINMLSKLHLDKDQEAQYKHRLKIKLELPIDEEGHTRIFYPWKIQSVYSPVTDENDDTVHDDDYYFHLHPELVHKRIDDDQRVYTEATICNECQASLDQDEKPRNSIASGVDFGSSARIGLEKLSSREQQIISYVRHYYNIIKIESNTRTLKEHSQSAIRGSSILFDQDTPQVVSDLLSAETINSNMILHFCTHEGKFDTLFKKTMDSKSADIFGRSYALYQWLSVLKVVNPVIYKQLNLPTFPAFQNLMKTCNDAFLAEALTTKNDDLIDLTEQMKDDVAGIRASTNVHHQIDESNDPYSDGKFTLRYSFLTSTDKTQFNKSSDSTHTYLKNVARAIGVNVDPEKEEYERHKSLRSMHPINEFEQGDYGLIAAFPHIFMLGKGYASATSNLSERDCAHLLLQFTTAPSSCSLLIFYLFDIKRRFENVRGMSAKASKDPKAFAEFIETFSSAEFQTKLQSAVANPNGKDAKYVLNKILPVLTSAGKHTSFGAVERNSSTGDLLAMIRRFGPQFQFLSCAFDDVHNPHSFRLTFRQPNNSDFPSTAPDAFLKAMKMGTSFQSGTVRIPTNWSALAAAVTGNPVAVAFMYKRLIYNIATILIGLKPSTISGSNNRATITRRFTSNSMNDDDGVIVGHATAFNGCHETNARGSLHFHITIWSAITAAVLQGSVDVEAVCDAISDILDSMYRGHIPRGYHIKDLIERQLPLYPNNSESFSKVNRKGRAMAIPPDPENTKKFDNHVYTTESYVGIHSHSAYIKGTCHNGPNGVSGCRLNMPRDLIPRTKPVELIDGSTYDEDTNKLKLRYYVHDNDKNTKLLPIRTRKEVMDKLHPKNKMNPLPDPDTRLIVWEIKRPLLAPLKKLPDSESTSKEYVITQIINAITDVKFKQIDDDKYYNDSLFEPEEETTFDLDASSSSTDTKSSSTSDVDNEHSNDNLSTRDNNNDSSSHLNEKDAKTDTNSKKQHIPTNNDICDNEFLWEWPTPKMLLKNQECYKTDTLRDGNCLFRNLMTYKGTLPSLSDIDSLRNDLMDYILSHSENQVTEVAKYSFCDIAVQNLNDIHKINSQGYNGFLQYTKIMRNSTPFQCEYGTMLEICAFAHSQRYNVAVYHELSEYSYQLCMSICIDTSVPTICLLLDKLHYETLCRKNISGVHKNADKVESECDDAVPSHTSVDLPTNKPDEDCRHNVAQEAEPDPKPTPHNCPPVYPHIPEDTMFDEEELAKLIDDLNGMTLQDLTTMYNAVAAQLEKRNGYVVEFNPILTAVLGSNTCALLLGSSEQSKAAAYYIGPYVNKYKCALVDSLDIVWEAMEHVKKYPSIAEDTGTKKRVVQHIMTRILNKLNSLMEISDTQAAAALLGLNVSLCSEIFSVYDSRSYINYALNESTIDYESSSSSSLSDSDPDSENDSDIDNSSDNAENKSIKNFIVADDTQNNEHNDDPPTNLTLNDPKMLQRSTRTKLAYYNSAYGSCPLYPVDDNTRLVAIPYPMLYRYRGWGLRNLNRLEYCSCVRVVKYKKNEDTDNVNLNQHGRRKTYRYAFDEELEIHASHYQILRSKMCTPKMFKNPPPPPGLKPTSNDDHELKSWHHKANKFATYYLVMFRPESELYSKKQDFKYSYNWDAFVKFIQDLKANDHIAINKFRLAQMRRMILSLKTTTRGRAILSHYRGRKRDLWSEKERMANIKAMKKEFLRSRHNLNNDMEEEIDNLMASKQLSSKTERDIMRKVAFTDQLTNQLKNLNASKMNSTSSTVPKARVHSVKIQPFDENLANGITQTEEVETSESETERPNQEAKIGNASTPVTTEEKFQQYLATKNLSQDKLLVVNEMYNHFKSILDGSAEEKDQPMLLITGAPGTGKSWLITAISEIAELMDLESPIKTTFMGIAAINIGGHTMCTFLNIPTELEGIPNSRVIHWDTDKLEAFKNQYKIDKLSAIIIDEISMVKPWMLAYLDARLKEVTGSSKPFGGIPVLMFGDFDQQPPIGGSSLPQLSMKFLAKKYQQKNHMYYVNQTREEKVEMKSHLSATGVKLFQQAGHLRLTKQHRCAQDPEHMSLLNTMNSGSKITAKDLELYKTLSKDDLTPEEFLFATIIVTGNYERHEINALQAKVWAETHHTHVIRWKREVNLAKWKNRPASPQQLEAALNEVCFWEYFVPMAPSYLTYNLNVKNKLANGTLVQGHSLSFETKMEETFLKQMIKSTPIGQCIDLPSPPKAVNIEIFPNFDGDDASKQQENAKQRKEWKLGSMAKNGRVIIPISIDHHTKVRWTKESVRARGGNICFRASTVPMRDFFPLELGFCITVPKCQVSGFCPLSKLPSPTWNLTTNHIIIREEQFGGLLLPCLSTPLPS